MTTAKPNEVKNVNQEILTQFSENQVLLGSILDEFVTMHYQEIPYYNQISSFQCLLIFNDCLIEFNLLGKTTN